MKRSRPSIGYRHAQRQRSDPKWCKKHGKTLITEAMSEDNYLGRSIVLLKLGFKSYDDYLNSPLWASIRAAAYGVHGSDCLICNRPAICIHHLDYSIETLKGINMAALIPICEKCHRHVEFDGDKKRSVNEVRQITLSLLPNKTKTG